MSLLWAANAARRKKAVYVAGSSRWVANELNNQFMDSFHLIEEFYENINSDHDNLTSTINNIYLGAFDLDSISSIKSPIKKIVPKSSSTANTPTAPTNNEAKPTKLEYLELSSIRKNDISVLLPVNHSVETPSISNVLAKPNGIDAKENGPTTKSTNDNSIYVSDGIEDSFQAISKSIRKSIAERTTGVTFDHRRVTGSPPPPPTVTTEMKTSHTLKTTTSVGTAKSADRLTLSKRGRSSMFVALPPREPIVINSSSRSRKSTLKPRATVNLLKPESEPEPEPEPDLKVKPNSPIQRNSNATTMTNNVDLLDKFAISPVQLPTTRKFFYDTPQPTSIINNSVHLKIDNNADKDGQQEHIHIVKSGSLEGELQNTQRQNTISPAEKNLKTTRHNVVQSEKSPNNEAMDVDNLWGKIGRYRSLSPVRKPLTGAVSATKSASTMQPLSRSRSRSKSPTRRERTRTTTNWGSPTRGRTLQRTSRSPRRTAILDGEHEVGLVNRLTAPTSSSAAKTKPVNRKTIEGKKVERNRFLTATLIPTTHEKSGGVSKSKDGSPTKPRIESHKFPKFEPGDIPKLKLPVSEKRNETTKTKFIIKPLNRKSELAKVKAHIQAQTENEIINSNNGNKHQQEGTESAAVHAEDLRADKRIKRVKTGNGIALPDAARRVLNKDNASKKHIQATHVTPTRPTSKKYPDILPATPTQITPGSLPTILSDDDLAVSNKNVLQSWAQTPVLRRTIMNSRSVDPTTVFRSHPKIDLKETFQNEESVQRGQQSPFPTPNPKQRKKEAKRYTQQMGYIS